MSNRGLTRTHYAQVIIHADMKFLQNCTFVHGCFDTRFWHFLVSMLMNSCIFMSTSVMSQLIRCNIVVGLCVKVERIPSPSVWFTGPLSEAFKLWSLSNPLNAIVFQ